MTGFVFGSYDLLPFFFMLAIVYGALEVSNFFQNKGVKETSAAKSRFTHTFVVAMPTMYPPWAWTMPILRFKDWIFMSRSERFSLFRMWFSR